MKLCISIMLFFLYVRNIGIVLSYFAGACNHQFLYNPYELLKEIREINLLCVLFCSIYSHRQGLHWNDPDVSGKCCWTKRTGACFLISIAQTWESPDGKKLAYSGNTKRGFWFCICALNPICSSWAARMFFIKKWHISRFFEFCR